MIYYICKVEEIRKVELINSEKNQWLKKIKALQKRKYREEQQQFVIEGSRFCQEAIASKAQIEALFISETIINNKNIKDVLAQYHGKYFITKAKLLEKCLSTVNPQGIAAIVNNPSWEINEILFGKLIVIIDGVQDPGNLGTIIRTSLAAGVDGMLCLKGTVDLYNDKSLRSTMGAIFNLPVFYIDNTESLKKLLVQKGFKLIIADVNANQYHYDCSYPDKIALILGSESKGPLQITQGDIMVKIPLYSKAESLNVAVAGGIILYEIDRQRRLNL